MQFLANNGQETLRLCKEIENKFCAVELFQELGGYFRRHATKKTSAENLLAPGLAVDYFGNCKETVYKTPDLRENKFEGVEKNCIVLSTGQAIGRVEECAWVSTNQCIFNSINKVIDLVWNSIFSAFHLLQLFRIL